MKRHCGMAGSGNRGAALIITLAFMILLTGLLIIFFTQALSYRQQSNSTFNDFKSATIAQSALETVVGDLRQEMVNGSTNYTYGSGANTSYLYIPTNNFVAVPQRSGTNYTSGGVDTTPNLVRISIRSDGIIYPGVGSRASAVSSTTPAYSGQYVSLARWNKHYLLPRGTNSAGVALPGSTLVDTTPTNTFTPPDWVFVTSSGPAVLTTPSTAVIGRYAYAIYDEGGLLDANVVGVPSNTATNTAPNPTPIASSPLNWGFGMKGSEAFADLTVTNTITQAPMFAQTNINELVGWRNNATAQPSGNFTNGYTFAQANAVSYHNYVVGNTNGFLVTSGNSYIDPSSGNTNTDQVFTSRQALINFAITSGIPQDSLQYLATFTRALEQPNYVPPKGRPMVQNATNAATTTPFGSGNDAYHLDRVTTNPTTNAPSDINPPFLNVRVTSAFTRIDGTSANVGDPLIKERFPLSRLSLFPTNEAAPSAAAAALIYQYFGLTYQAASGTTAAVWLYNHDANNTTGIDRLAVGPNNTAAVTVQGREPDFFELLKAAINVGSLGKGCAINTVAGQATYTNAGNVGNIVQAHDTVTNLQILQIGANIIDQSKTDNFPTRIQFSGDSSSPPNVVCGSEDLPYIYRLRNWISQYSTSQIAYLIQPEIWDPYSYSGASSTATAVSAAAAGESSSGFVSAANTPKNFRVRLEPDPTILNSPYTASPLNVTAIYNAGDSIVPSNVSVNTTNFVSSVGWTAPATPVPNPAPLTFSAGELNGNWGFRQPTLLAQPGLTTTGNLNSGSPYSPPNYTDVNNHANLTGFLIATFPWISPNNGGSDNASKLNVSANSNPSCLRCYLDYQDPNNPSNYINYDQEVFQTQQSASSWAVNAIGIAANNTYTKSLQSVNYDDCGFARTDPRTARWGALSTEYFYLYPIINSPTDTLFPSARDDGGISYGSHIEGHSDVGFVNPNGYNASPYRGFQEGYWAENSVRATYQTDSGDSGLRYNLDPDGIPRRAMAGYVTDVNNGGTAGTSASLPATGLPLFSCYSSNNYNSRPTILHRPFRSVAELGYVFRDTPWGDINFTFPESGDSPLLDVFCINDTSTTSGLVAGRVDLNTRQAPVLAALISGSLRDKDDPTTPVLSQAMANDLATRLVARTTATTLTSTTQGPLMSRADLVGTWMPVSTSATVAGVMKTAAAADTISPDTYYTGFSYDIGTAAVPSVNGTANVALISRQRNAVMRALVDAGTTRTWNLLIDLVAQSGRFPPTAVAAGAAGLPQFVVEGEKHYWLHVAIDRYTGKVIDSQLEVVRE